MKQCTYILGDQKFKSELALDEYLLNNEEYYKQYGDEVFLRTTEQNATRAILINSDKEKNRLYKVKRQAQITEGREDYYQVEAPYVGVNKFIGEYRRTTANNEGKPFSPVFIIENYILEKSKDWKNQDYWDNKATEEEKRDIFGDNPPRPLTTADELLQAQKRLETKWKHQSYLGTAIHEAMSLWWKADKKHKKTVEDFEAYLRNTLNGTIGDSGIRYNEIIPGNVWRQMSEHCFGVAKELEQKYPGASYMTEIGLHTDITYEGKNVPLVGVADLVVIDKKGNVQLIDYKTSPKSYGDYNDAKKRTFYYQLAIYRRMMQRLGINMNEHCGVYIIPFKFENFRYNYETDSSTFDNLYSEAYNPQTGNMDFSYLEELPILEGTEAENMRPELDSFIPLPKTVDTRATDVLEKTEEFMKDCFESFVDDQQITDEKIIDSIERQNQFKKNASGNYYYKYGTEIIQHEDKIELIALVKKRKTQARNFSPEVTQGFKHAIVEGQKRGRITFNKKQTALFGKHGSEQWMVNTFSKYLDKSWEILSMPPVFDELGIVLIKNKFNNQIDVITIGQNSWQSFDETILLGGASYQDVKHNTRRLITGNFEADIVQKQRPKSLVMESNYGNIELMKTMAVLNMFPNLISNNNGIIGNVMAVNMSHQQGFSASSEQLLYNFRELQNLRNKRREKQQLEKVDDNFYNGNLKMATWINLIQNQVIEVLSGDKSKQFSGWSTFKDCITAFDSITRNPIKLRAQLMDLLHKIENHRGYEYLKTSIEKASYEESQHPERRLYYHVLMAIAEIDGVNYTQQSKDHSSWLESIDILREGIAGTQIDNPGNMSSETLNYINQQVTVAYQNIRNDLTRLNQELRNRINKLKEHKKYGYLESRTVGNQASLYKDMYYEEDGDLFFRNPWDPNSDLDEAEREFLMFALKVINGNRMGLKTEEEFDNKRLSDPQSFFAVPLTPGSLQSQVSVNGLLKTIKNKIFEFSPSKIKETVRKKIEGYLVEDSQVEAARKSEQWEMINMFSATEGRSIAEGGYNVRKQVIANAMLENPDLGMGYFERNLETLLLKHTFAYSQKQHIDKVFPVIKAGMMHLSMQGIILNDQFVQDIQYLTDFIKNKIFNLSLHDAKWRPYQMIAGELMSGASKIALVFNPRQMYQNIDGIWKDISLMIRKPDNEYSFTAKNMKDSFFWIYKDLIHFGNKKSLGELLNEQDGLTDMDIKTLTSRMSSDNVGVWNFWDVGFRFASRPDYYNRMTIFTAQMRGDGCFEAHYVNDKGELVYDWTKDKRFDLFAKTEESDVSKLSKEDQQKYQKQKALYIAMARQFMAEHAMNSDGNEFVYNPAAKNALPRAYTTQQSESMKSLSDSIYGYYSHEKKALFQAHTLGSMFMQMNTFWSSKKNQWFAPGGVKVQGRMEQYEENGVKYWHKLDEDGNITNEPVPDGDPNASTIPYMQWKGQFQEGIAVTLWNMILDLYQGDLETGEHSIRKVLNNYFNNSDPNLRRAYRNNLHQAWFDLLMMLIFGMWLTPAMCKATKEYIGDVGNDSFVDALVNNCLLNSTEMISSSFDDFNMVKSVFGRGAQWTPFSIQSAGRVCSSISNLLTGSTDLYDTAIKFSSMTRTQEPIWDYVKISTLGRSIGDNGDEEEE